MGESHDKRNSLGLECRHWEGGGGLGRVELIYGRSSTDVPCLERLGCDISLNIVVYGNTTSKRIKLEFNRANLHV